MLELNRLKGDRDLDSRQALQNKNITEIVILSPIVEDVYEKTEVPKRNLEDVLKEISEQ